jgi:hypothetical protein
MALEGVAGFLDHMAEWPLAFWLTIGRELSASGTLLARQLAWADVEAALADQRLELAAWHVRDAIETTICLASGQRSRWSREERCAFAAAHGAAEGAALAMLVGKSIPANSMRVLCAPFATLLERG